MKTIEDCELEIETKTDIIKDRMTRFEQNIGRIGSVIGKDSTDVYQLLLRKFNETIDMYNTGTRRSVEVLGGYIATLDNINVVLDDVMVAIDKIEGDRGEDLTEKFKVDEIMEKVSEMTDAVVSKAEQAVEQVTGKEVSTSTVKAGVYGIGSFLLMKALGIGKAVAVAGAAATAYYVASAKK